MAKQLNVDMRFTADTVKAKQAITELQTAIQKLGYGSSAAGSKIIDPAQFEQASAAARELAYHLNNAYNVKTGNLDLSKLNASLKSSGTNLAKLTSSFKDAGTTGQQAFIALANAIASADQPTITLNTQLSTMFTTIKNVARFQISSSIIHGLIGGIQSAYGYAQDLNQSLNNIRIVTGQSTDQMARFAEQANKAARSLSATTLDYTNASLIYYQQGLDDEAVKARTDVTVKLANVSRQSAEEVSSQMTAIWENFDNGAHSMEYFADVITALGATTASSSEEIATGLSKFAPVAGTIGLSYEKASAALAAIIANTRQSADTVGTGLRTIFSRFESLKLGETLEDGVDLNKYTKAMQIIGVNVLDANGKLRDMDSILDDIAKHWNELDNTQKTAFATTVGGVRQYTNLMALFENWDDVQKNMLTASGAEGTLQNQADTYAESWEAARDRVRAATESIYRTLIDEDFFIGVDKVVEHILVGVRSFIDNFGGVKNLLISTLSFVLTMTASKIGPAVQKVVQDIQIMTGGASKVYAKMQTDFNAAVNSEIASGKYSTTGEAELKSSQQLLLAKTKLGAVNDKLSASERMRAELAIQGYQQQAKEIKRLTDAEEKAAEKVDQAQQKVAQAKEKAQAKARTELDKAQEKAETANIRAEETKAQFNEDKGVSANDKMFSLGDKYIKQYSGAENFDEIKKLFQQIEDAAYESGIRIKDKLMDGFESSIRNGTGIDISTEMTQLFSADELTLPPDAADSLDQYKQKIEVLGASLGNVQEYAPNVADALRQISRAETPEEYNKALENLRSECAAVEIPASKVEAALKNLGGNPKSIDNYSKALQNLKKANIEAEKAEQHLNDVKANSAATDADVAQAEQELADAKDKAKKASEDLTKAQNDQNEAVAKFNPQHMVTGLEAMTTLAGGLGSLAMGINAVKSAFDAWGNADMSFGEKLTSSLMAISMVVPSVIALMKTFRTVSSFISKSLMTVNGALLANTLALAAVAAIILLVTKHIQNQNKAIKENADQTIEATQAILDQAEANRELVNSFESALSAYEAAKAAGEDLTESQAALASAAREAANAYYLEGAALAELTGNYDNFAKDIEKARSDEISNTIDTANRGKEAVSTKMLLTAREGTGYIYGQYDDNGDQIGTGYKAHFGDGFLGGADDRAIAAIVKGGDFKYLSKQAGDNSINLNMSDFNAENLVAAYDEIGQVLAKARETMTDEELTKSETYQKMRDWYNKMTESAEQYKEYAQTIADLNIENKDRSGALGIKSSDVKTLEDYQSLRSKMIASLKAEKGITDETSEEFQQITASVDAYLGSLESLSNFKLQNDAIADFNKISGGDIQKWATDNGVDLEVALQINPYLPESLWDEQIALIQAKADREKILVQIETVQAGKDLVGNSKATSSDWVDWKESFSPEDWNNFLETSGFSDFSEFLVLSDEDKTKILNSYQDVLKQQAEAAREEVRAETEERKAANEAWLIGGSYEGSSFVTNEAKYQRARSSNEYLESQMSAWNKKKQGNEELTESEAASIEGWDEAMAQHAATQIEANNEIIQSYEGVRAAIDADAATLQKMTDEDAAEQAIGWLDDFKASLEGTDLKYDDIKEYADYLRDAAKAGDGVAKSLEEQTQGSLELATKLSLLQRAIDKLHNNLNDYTDVLKGTNKGTKEYASQLSGLQDIMKDLVGTADFDPDGSIFDGKFFEQNAELFQKAANGDREAIWELQKAAAEQIVLNIDNQGAVQEFQTIIEGLEALVPEDLEIGTSISEIEGADAYMASLQALLAAGQITADEVNAALGAIGFEPEIVQVPISAVSESTIGVNGGQDVEINGQSVHVSSEVYETAKSQGVATIPVISSSATRSTARAGGGGLKLPSGSSGGGGGGGSKTKEKKNPTDERDRYHTITEKIKDATDAYDKLSKAEDRAFGKERIKAMEGITDNLKLQIELQKRYIDEIKNYLVGDREAVEALGAQFDINGVITNYDNLIAELVNKYNEGVDLFNAGDIDEDAFKEQYEEPFNDAKEAIDQYVETINLLQSEELNLIDLQNDLADQLREIAAYKLELNIDLDEDELKYLDFLLEMLGDNVEKAVDALTLLGQKFNTTKIELDHYVDGIKDLLALRGFSDSDIAAFLNGELTVQDLENRGFTTDDIDKLREYRDAIQENTEALKELQEEIEAKFLDVLDELNEKVEDAEDRFNHFTKMFEHFQNVVDIVGQDALGMTAETMKMLAQAAKENAIEMVKAAKTQLDSLIQVRAQAQAQLDAALEAQKNASTEEERIRAEEAAKYWSDMVDETQNRIDEAQESLADALENALESIKNEFSAALQQATKEFEASVTGNMKSLDLLATNFDRSNEVEDLYIPAYEKIYELTKLTRDINKSIDDTDSLWSKRELAKIQDEINQKMEDGVQLTEHDVEELRKRYELKLAEAALEEAQNSKNTVRMSRDNEGNWSYVYTADENDVAAAQQNYEDKLYEYQKMNADYIRELQENMIQVEQDMRDAINDLDVTSFASQEEYYAEVQRIIDAAQAKQQAYYDQMAQTLEQQGTLYNEDWQRYHDLTGYRMARDEEWVNQWDETTLAQLTGFETLDQYFNALNEAIGGPDDENSYVGQICEAYREMQESNERALNAAGTSMNTYSQDVTSAVNDINEEIENTQNKVEEFSEKMTNMMKDVSSFIGEWKKEYGAAIEELTRFNDDLYKSCEKLITMLQKTYGVNAEFEGGSSVNDNGTEGGPSGSTRNGDSGSRNNSESGSSNISDRSEQPGNPIVYTDPCPKGGNHDWEYINTTMAKGYHCRKCNMLKNWSDIGGHRNYTGYKSGGYTGTWISSAKTGMYTGSWAGPDLEENGRLAFLHQKELVLNANDTKNFLSAVDIVRQISQTIDLQAASRSNGWNFLLPGVLGREPDTLDQNVHIEAHFPNVTSHSEIEEAFTNLVGKASQFANR